MLNHLFSQISAMQILKKLKKSEILTIWQHCVHFFPSHSCFGQKIIAQEREKVNITDECLERKQESHWQKTPFNWKIFPFIKGKITFFWQHCINPKKRYFSFHTCPASTRSDPQSHVVLLGIGSEQTSISSLTSLPDTASTSLATEYLSTCGAPIRKSFRE